MGGGGGGNAIGFCGLGERKTGSRRSSGVMGGGEGAGAGEGRRRPWSPRSGSGEPVRFASVVETPVGGDGGSDVVASGDGGDITGVVSGGSVGGGGGGSAN